MNGADAARDRAALPLGDWNRIADTGSFEEVLAALDLAVASLEAGRLSLGDSLACYEAGMRLAARCETFLNEAELRVRRIEETTPEYRATEENDLDLA